MQLSLPSSLSPDVLAVTLLSEVYGQHIPGLVVSPADKVRLPPAVPVSPRPSDECVPVPHSSA